jgi:hypothetical protein
MRKLCLIAVMFLLLVSVSYAFDANELPYGMYCTVDTLILDDISIMADSLGMNFVYGNFSSDVVEALDQAGYDVIKWGNPTPADSDYYRMSGYSYFKVEAEDASSPIRFETRLGMSQDIFQVYSGQDTMLDDLWFDQNNEMRFGSGENPKQFYAKVRMRIDPTGMNLGDLIGRILVQREDSTNHWSVRASYDILATQALLDTETVEVPEQSSSFTLNDATCECSYKVKYSYWNNGHTVYIDYFTAYEDEGKNVINGDYDGKIQANVTGGWKDDVDYWWIRDEPHYDHFMPWARVESLVNDATGRSSSISAFYLPGVRRSWTPEQQAIGLNSFEQITRQDKIVINDYYITGGYSTWHFTEYSGYNDNVYQDSTNSRRGLQKELELTSCKLFNVVTDEIKNNGILDEFWSSPQCFYQVYDSSWGGEPPSTMYSWRPMTRSEHRLNVYLPLCYGARGLCLWLYHYGTSSDAGHPTSFGFYTGPGQRNEEMWDVYANDITPYIKAIDSTYMGLYWERAYACSSGVPINPPSGNFVSSISATSNTNESNPDLGWFEVGEFTEAHTGDRHIMLLNRACSRGMWDSTEAPSITATVRFNPSTIGSNYVLITDLADSLRHAGGDTGWVGIPKTTYSAKMPDGTIPYTIALRAGEGRLLKIAATSKTTLPH